MSISFIHKWRCTHTPRGQEDVGDECDEVVADGARLPDARPVRHGTRALDARAFTGNTVNVRNNFLRK